MTTRTQLHIFFRSGSHFQEFCPFLLTFCLSDKASEGDTNVKLNTQLDLPKGLKNMAMDFLNIPSTFIIIVS